MLFLTKKTMVAVLALGCLFSVTPQAKAAWSPNKEQVGLVAGLAVAYVTQVHQVDQTKKEKNVVTRALDSAKETTSTVVNHRYTKFVAVTGGIALLAHYYPQIWAAIQSVGGSVAGK